MQFNHCITSKYIVFCKQFSIQALESKRALIIDLGNSINHMMVLLMQVEGCLRKLMNRQLSAAFNAMWDATQKAAHKREALRFWTHRNLYAAFNAFR